MKNLFFILVMPLAFIMNACGQNEVAMADNSKTIATTETSSLDTGKVSAEVKKLKAEFLKEIKQQYFIDKGLKVPSDLEIILISKVYDNYYSYFSFGKKMICLYKNDIGQFNSWEAEFIQTRHKMEKNIIYKK